MEHPRSLNKRTPQESSLNNFSDEKLIHIYELQDKRDTESLIPFLKAKKESHRVAAALAFASIQDSVAIPYLNQMLQIDQDELPRRAAAMALEARHQHVQNSRADEATENGRAI